MKKLFVLAALFCAALMPTMAQKINHNGDTWSQVQAVKGLNKDTTETKELWMTKDGTKHKIILSANGRAYIWRKSAKTGNWYKQYLGEEVSREICKIYGVKYIEKTNN